MKIVIVGGGISGLLAAHVLRRHNPVLLEGAPNLGGNFTAGGLKYIRRTPRMVELLRSLSIEFSDYTPIGKLFFAGIQPHPEWLLQQNHIMKLGVQSSHWLKTRGSLDGFRNDCMNDPAGECKDAALKCDHSALVSRLVDSIVQDQRITVRTGVRIEHISATMVVCSGESHDYTRLIPTIPVWALSKLSPWADLPDLKARTLGIVDVEIDKSVEPTWDYMYTPMAEVISRMTWPKQGTIQLELPGVVGDEAPKLLADLVSMEQFIGTITGMGQPRNIPGHLQNPGVKIFWPFNWLPLGRFAEWKPRATSEKVLDRVADWSQSL